MVWLMSLALALRRLVKIDNFLRDGPIPASLADEFFMRIATGRPGDDERPRLSTHQKALKINLDPVRYGTFAEVGAGQEVARWFFKVGAAAGTVSKSMSAYDMAVSDSIYGACRRYVSRE